jgi:NitT/TauT family transport system substrate-binding protein
MSIRDVILVPMPQNAMPAAFADGLVSAAVCFPPESNRILEAGGKVLFHSGQVPGQVIDTLVFDGSFVARRGPDVPAFMTAYYKAVALMASQPDEAHAIMARRENMGVQELRDTLSGMHFVSRAEQPALLAPGGPVERSLNELQGAMMALAQLRQARNLKDFLIAREFVADAGALA